MPHTPTVLITLILISAIVAWASIGIRLIRGGQLSRKSMLAVTAFTVSPILLFIFGFGDFQIWDSRRFAAVAVPCCLLAIVLAVADAVVSRFLVPLGVAFGSVLNIAIWLYLMMVH